jgi:predicted amidophosphoribosyltransferase
MATVAEVTAPYGNVLVPILGPGQVRCAVCKSVVREGFSLCYQCNRQVNELSYTANVVVPVALSVKGGQWAYELSAYKNASSLAARQTMEVKIGAVLWRWLESHESHVAEAARVRNFPIVTSVPSTSGRLEHPLSRMLRNVVTPISCRYYDLLSANPSYPRGSREARDDRFTAHPLQGQPVLLIDDQWTSGGRMQSAAAALRMAGSGPVAAVALGRHFDPRPNGDAYLAAAQGYLQAASKQGWDWNRCCLQN